MNATDIQYLRSSDGTPGFSWNPITGCAPGLSCWYYCWARKMSQRLKGRFGYDKDEPFKPTFHADRLEEPMRIKKPATIATCFMGDLFLATNEQIDQVFAVMSICEQHTFLALTKRTGRMAKYLADSSLEDRIDYICHQRADGVDDTWHYPAMWPLPNVLLGTSISTQAEAGVRIPHLLDCLGRKWLSIEPIEGPINLEPYLSALDWIVVGGGPFPVHPDWVRDIRDQCKAAEVPFFFKQWGAWLPQSQFEPGMVWSKSREDHYFDPHHRTLRVGKKMAGRLLDGIEYSELPEGRP